MKFLVKVNGKGTGTIVQAHTMLAACSKVFRRRFRPIRHFGVWRHIETVNEFGVYALDKFSPENLIVRLTCEEARIKVWIEKEVD